MRLAVPAPETTRPEFDEIRSEALHLWRLGDRRGALDLLEAAHRTHPRFSDTPTAAAHREYISLVLGELFEKPLSDELLRSVEQEMCGFLQRNPDIALHDAEWVRSNAGLRPKLSRVQPERRETLLAATLARQSHVEGILSRQLAGVFAADIFTSPETPRLLRQAHERHALPMLSAAVASPHVQALPARARIDATAASSLREIGDAFLALGRPEEALAVFGDLPDSDPPLRVARYLGTACALLDLERLDEACDWASAAAACLEEMGEADHAGIIRAAAMLWSKGKQPPEEAFRSFEVVIFCRVSQKLRRNAHLGAPGLGLLATVVTSLRRSISLGADIPITVYYDHRVSPMHQEYLKNLVEHCGRESLGLAVNTAFGLRAQWLHAMEHTKSEYILVVEQDHEFYPSGFDYTHVLRAMAGRPDIGQVRLNRRTNIPKKWDRLLSQTTRDITSGWCRTGYFSNTVNFLRRPYFDAMIHPMIHQNTRNDFANQGAGGVEENVMDVMSNFKAVHGPQASLRVFGQAIWGAPGQPRVCQHMGV